MQQRIKPFWIILALWIIALLIVNPIGDFPLNDDWAYALSVKNWLETGQFKIIDWPAMSLFTHVVWGTIWAKIFGFSFTVLRFSVLSLAAISVWIFSLIIKSLDFSWEQQFVVLAAIVFNPMFFYLSNTFMTDVSFLFFCMLSVYGFLRYFSFQKWVWWGLAILGAVLAILVRQLGLLIPVAFGLAMVWRKFSVRNIVTAVAGILITYGSLKIYLGWLAMTVGLPASFASIDSVYSQLRPTILLGRMKSMLGFYFVYVGGYLMPLWVLTTKGFDRRMVIAFIICLPILGWLTFPWWDRLPRWNTVYDFGIGPVSMTDVLRGHSNLSVLSIWQGSLIKLVGYLGAILLLWNGLQGIRRIWINRKTDAAVYHFRMGVLLFAASFVLYLLTDAYNFDRYLLPLIIFSFLLSPKSVGRPLWPALLVLLPLVWFTISGTHDYLAWNRARWAGLNELQAKGVQPNEIDGGFEFNGWHQTHALNPDNPFAKSWWFVDHDRYAIAFTPYKNYEIIAAYPFQRYLTGTVDSMLVLERPGYQKTTRIDSKSLGTKDSLFVRYQPADYLPTKHFPNLITSDTSAVFHMSTQKKYAFPHQLFPVKPFEKISLSFDLYGDRKSFLVVNSAPKVKDFYYNHLPYRVEKKPKNWQKMVVEMEIPADFPSDTLKIYFWKQKAEEELYIRDLELVWQRF